MLYREWHCKEKWCPAQPGILPKLSTLSIPNNELAHVEEGNLCRRKPFQKVASDSRAVTWASVLEWNIFMQ